MVRKQLRYSSVVLLWIASLLGRSLARAISLVFFVVLAFARPSRAQSTDPADQVCPRYAPGSVVSSPPDLYSQNGVLTLNFTYQTAVDEQGLTRYCYISNGNTTLQAPTLPRESWRPAHYQLHE